MKGKLYLLIFSNGERSRFFSYKHNAKIEAKKRDVHLLVTVNKKQEPIKPQSNADHYKYVKQNKNKQGL